MEFLDTFEEKMRFASQRIVWQWCSRVLRPAWERQTFGRIDILLGIAPALGFSSDDLDSFGVNILSGIPLSEQGIRSIVNDDPATILYLALQGVALDDIPEQFRINRHMDKISKLTIARERQYSDGWTQDGLCPTSYIAGWQEGFHPLEEALTLRLIENKDRLTRLLADIIPGLEIDEQIELRFHRYINLKTKKLRRTPKGLLNMATRLKLKKVVDHARTSQQFDKVFDSLLAALPDALIDVIERAGHTPFDVIADFVNHDMRTNRQSFFCLDRQPRPRLP